MATCAQVITYALRMNRIIGSGKDPTTAELADGMIALQALYDQWRTGGMFGNLEDVYLDENDTAEEGYRYFVPTGLTLTDATSVYDDGGETRQPRDLALYESLTQAGTHAAKLYDRTAWVPLTGLVQADTAPLSARDSWGLAACLSTTGGLCAMFGAEPAQATIAKARHFLRNLMDKSTTQDRTTPDYF
jgi:hypothetical protein